MKRFGVNSYSQLNLPVDGARAGSSSRSLMLVTILQGVDKTACVDILAARWDILRRWPQPHCEQNTQLSLQQEEDKEDNLLEQNDQSALHLPDFTYP